MKENKRKCLKCGSSPAEDSSITLYRFPKPGKTNIRRCELWAQYCFPQKSWNSRGFQEKLFCEHRMLCHKHFKISSFYDFSIKRLNKFAVPDYEPCDLYQETTQMQMNSEAMAGTSQSSAAIKNCDEYLQSPDFLRKGPLHHFPKLLWPHMERFNSWKSVLRQDTQDLGDNYIFNQVRLCYRHFESYYCLPSKLLTRNAIPTLNLGWSDAVKQTESSISTLAECKPTQDSTSVKDLLPMSQPQPRRSSVSEDNFNVRKVAREPELFSWQKDSPIVCDETSLNSESTDSIGDSNLNDDICSMENTSKSAVASDKQKSIEGSDKDLHEGYKCDLCRSPIFSFRYACVQCDNFDLCGACEARGKHATHYVLRVPTPKPFGEVRLLIHTLKQILSANQFFLKPNTNYNDDLVNEIKSEAGSETERDPMSEVPDLTIMSSDSSDHEESEFDCDDNIPSKSSPEFRVPPRANSDHLVIEARRDNTHNVTATPEKHTLYVANDKNIKSNREIDKASNSSQQSLRESKVKSNPQVRVDIEWLDEDFLQENHIAQYDTQTVDSTPPLDNTKNSNKRLIKKPKLNQSLTPTKRRNDISMIINVPNSSKEQWKIIKQSLESKACVRLERLSEDITLSVIK